MSAEGQGALDTEGWRSSGCATLSRGSVQLRGSKYPQANAPGWRDHHHFIARTRCIRPDRLPEFKELGEWTAELRSAARDLRRGLQAEVADIKQVGEHLKAPLDELKKSSDEVRKGIEESGVSRLDWEGPKPISGPTPADAMADLEEIEKKAAEEGPQR